MGSRNQPENHKNQKAEGSRDTELGQPPGCGGRAGSGPCLGVKLISPPFPFCSSDFQQPLLLGRFLLEKLNFLPSLSGTSPLSVPGHSSSSWPWVPEEPRDAQQGTKPSGIPISSRNFPWKGTDSKHSPGPAIPGVPSGSQLEKRGTWLTPFNTTRSAAAQLKPII